MNFIQEIDYKNNWHPYTQMEEYQRLGSLNIDYGKGSWLYDENGKKYLDGTASLWCNVHGHRNKRLNNALIKQIKKVSHSTFLGMNHIKGSTFTQKLINAAPKNLSRIFYTDNGSCAIETALKLSLKYWINKGLTAKNKILKMEGGYHGDTIGAMSVSDHTIFHKEFQPWLFETITFPRPQYIECNNNGKYLNNQNTIEEIKKIISLHKNKIACIVMEPCMQSPGSGLNILPNGFLNEVSNICKDNEIHLILDEIFVGFFRCGNLFACLAENVTPNFLCLSKGLSSGYLPLGATITNEEIYNSFLDVPPSQKTFYHGHTFCANPLALAVAEESLNILSEEKILHHIHSITKYFSKEFENNFKDFPYVKNIRQKGLVAGFDIIQKNGIPYHPSHRTSWQVCIKAREKGLLIRPIKDSIYFVPPIMIKKNEIDFLFKTTLASLTEILKYI